MEVTECASNYNALESMPLATILKSINNEDAKVAHVIHGQIEAIEQFVFAVEIQNAIAHPIVVH